ncbi:tape measure protein [Brucella oryzae]|uniref:Tape measure protein N-terminal domain-containing protein n=1 Tax=Brucella oryzae TaxID=335286 RepID=A0A2S7IW89_9HYPH|nr:tape measure protein [Brucella oryzae]PQA72228.1 hypothetical protein C3731_17675 [Brucella oryzae]
MDLATLGLAVDSRPVREANDNLRAFQGAAKGAQTSADGYAQSAQKASRATEMLAQSANGSMRVIGLLKSALAGVGAAFSVKALIDLADGWSDITARVNLAAGSIEKGSAVMSRLSEIARNTYSSLAQTAEGYIANASSMRELGYSTQQVLDYTSALNNAMVISGAKAERAMQVQTALAKAMALGKLNGENLNTVIQNGGEVATLLAARFNTTTGGLLKLGQQGKLTGGILVDTLIKAMKDLEERAGEMPATIGDAFTLLGNAILRSVGAFDQSNKISETFANTLVGLADNMGRVITYGLTAATVWGVTYVAGMIKAMEATTLLARSMVILRGALMALGFGAVVVLLGEAAYWFTELVSKSGGLGNAFRLLGAVAVEVWERIKLGGVALGTGMAAVWEQMKASFLGALAVMQEKWADFLHNLGSAALKIPGMEDIGLGIKDSAIMAGSDVYAMSDAMRQATDRANELSEASRKASQESLKPLTSIAELQKVLMSGGGEGPNLSNDGGVARKLEETSKAAQKAKKAYDDLLLSAKQTVAQQKLEAETAGLTGIAQETLRFKLDLLQKAEEKRLNLSPKMKQALLDQVDAFEKYATAAAKATLQQDLLFERAQLGRTALEQTIASTLRGAGLEVDFNSYEAGLIRTNEQLKISKELSQDFAQGFVSDILNGTSALDALLNGLNKIADKLIQMAMDDLFAQAFGGGGGGILSGLFGGGGTSFFPAAPSMGGIGLFAKGGISNKPAIFGESGPEAAVPLPDGRSIPVRIYGEANSNQASGSAQGVHVTVGWSRTADGNLKPFVEDVAQKTAAPMINEGISQYDSQMLPSRVNQISQDPRAVGA